MRLKQIKLSGFKSFVDPTTVPFPDNLTAILGPNGCGKSNIIDAVRWVMGESSAKHLRGDSMTDVIFNGSNKRKPIGQASVELVFDNGEGKLQGEYANYNEIAIRRVVTRDAQNSYFLNNTRCRRKDITDIFLGTGLGPRSYAIIEQGMISRLIESKPQELRVFIEEAAGISKYKERRRETENRMRHTRENLERLNDVREELNRQLAHLQRQAAAAEKYKTLKNDERQIRAELSAIKWKKLNDNVQSLEMAIEEMNVELEAKNAVLTNIALENEKSRETHIELTDAFNTAQGKYYGIGSEISRIEQTIAHTKQRRQQLQQDIQRNHEAIQQAHVTLEQDIEKRAQLEEELLEYEPQLEECLMEAEEANMQLQEAEDAMQNWQQQCDNFNSSASGTQQQSQVLQTKIQHIESVLEKVAQRITRLTNELAEVNASDAADLDEQKAQLEEVQIELEVAEQSLDESQLALQQKKQHKSELEESYKTKRQQVNQLESEFIALEARQQAAIETENKQLANWLAEHGFSKSPKLAQLLKVDAGWERAVETVLSQHLDAICVDQLTSLFEKLQQAPVDSASFIAESKTQSKLQHSLASKVSGFDALTPLLNKVFIAESMAQAIAMLEEIQADQSVVTIDGVWLSQSWLKLPKKQSGMSVIERERKLNQLKEQLGQEKQVYDTLVTNLEKAERELDQLADQQVKSQQTVQQYKQTQVELKAHLATQESEIQQNLQRKQRIEAEINELKDQQLQEQELLSQSRLELEDIVENMGNDEARREQLVSQKEQWRSQLDRAREQTQQGKDKYHSINVKSERLKTEIKNFQETESRLRQQLESLQEHKFELEENLAQSLEPTDDLQEELEQALQKRIEAEHQLTEARNKLSEVEQQVRKMDAQKVEAEHQAQSIRLRIEKLRIDNQEFKVRRSTEEEYLRQHKYELQTLLDNLSEDDSEDSHNELLSRVTDRVGRLGAINLAAIDEYKVQSERKQYLDEQNADLEEALETLESAIKKIDRETRTRFKETFEKVNKGLQELFPKVFGGGHAYLEMTGEDLLDTGITIMARPPGKRNSTIHLLSGGEKALTAIALVFSIFHLNPAPFCMLDEVDAPLDDANVGRYCTLVKEMSSAVQFIYISHNKQAMEMASHLMGVTMQEPGVSRLVSVDLEEATELTKES